jgi:PE family
MVVTTETHVPKIWPFEFRNARPCGIYVNENHIQLGLRLVSPLPRSVVMTLRVVPEGLASASAAVEALTARLAAAHAGAVPLITAVVPPAADPVSLQSAAGFSVRGGAHTAVAAQGVEELGRSGIGVGESGTSYAAGDAAAASSYLPAGL